MIGRAGCPLESGRLENVSQPNAALEACPAWIGHYIGEIFEFHESRYRQAKVRVFDTCNGLWAHSCAHAVESAEGIGVTIVAFTIRIVVLNFCVLEFPANPYINLQTRGDLLNINGVKQLPLRDEVGSDLVRIIFYTCL